MKPHTPEKRKRLEQWDKMMAHSSRHVSSESYFAHKQRLAREAAEEATVEDEEEEEEEEGID